MRWKTKILAMPFIMATAATSHSSFASQSGAIEALGFEIQEARKMCAPAQIRAEAVDVDLAPKVKAEVVMLTSSDGICFGQPGANSYLVVQDIDGRWRVMLASEPGNMAIKKTPKTSVATIWFTSVGACESKYTWVGTHYRVTHDHCEDFVPDSPNLKTLAALINSARISIQTSLPPGLDDDATDGPQKVIGRAIAQERTCGWTSGDICVEKIFSSKATQLLHSYCTSSLASSWLAAIKHNDEQPVWDGDIFTRAQGISLVGANSFKIVRQSDDLADVDVGIETVTDAEGGSHQIHTTRFRMKLEDGSWKIDDLVFLHQQQPSPRGGKIMYRDESMKALLKLFDR